MQLLPGDDVIGLVPSTYVAPFDYMVIAPAGYVGVSEGDLSFGEGEELLIRPGLLPSEGW